MRNTRTIFSLVALTLVVGLASEASAAPKRRGGGNFGLGLVLGEPTGLTAKLFVSRRNALDFGLGVASGFYYDHGYGQRFHMDYLWHPTVLAANPTFTMPVYLGIGGFVASYHCCGRNSRDYDYNYTSIGPRVPVGLAMFFRGAPLELFFELAFAMDLFREDTPYDHRGAWLEGSIGLRYYF